MVLAVILAFVIAYLLGNVNGAIVISRIIAKEDVRTKGSGNAGLTNFTRNYGSAGSIFVILIDVGKAALACFLGGLLLKQYGMYHDGVAIGGLGVILGHDFPALLGFRGGKGILSGWFIAWMLDWRVGLLIAVVFFSVYFATHLVSLSSVLAAASFAVGFLIFHWGNTSVLVGTVFMGALTIFQHRANIVRLVNKQEKKVDLFKLGKK